MAAGMADLAFDKIGAKHVGVQEGLRCDSSKSILVTTAILRPVETAQIREPDSSDRAIIPLPTDADVKIVVARHVAISATCVELQWNSAYWIRG